MKKLIYSLIAVVLFTSIPLESYADANAHARNNCRFGKRYKSKAKVNGPNGCARTVLRDNNCTGVVSQAVLYRSMDCVCQGSTWGPTYAEGAYAYGRADGSGLETHSFKSTACSGYRAGGSLINSDPIKKPTKFDGVVRSELSLTRYRV
ncbi:MAG: hypothetical protein K0R65_1695 [Crocinitomicaceae bacterium]|nr:hypothetical protein [Crocinitomicaceae bacterium]